MNFRILFFTLFITLLIPHYGIASPVTDMGSVSESVLRSGGTDRQIVPTARGRHGIDLAYYENGRLYINEIKSGSALQRIDLSLSDDELSLLKRNGITPERLPSLKYQITQGSHAYNMVQFDRSLRYANNFGELLGKFNSDRPLGNNEIKEVGRYIQNLDMQLGDVDRRQVKRIIKTGNLQELRLFMARNGEAVRNQHAASLELLKKSSNNILRGQYTNQLIRLDIKDGRWTTTTMRLDTHGNPIGTPATTSINWNNLRESAPLRRAIQEQATNLCRSSGARALDVCQKSAYRVAKQALDQGKSLHEAMTAMNQSVRPTQAVVHGAQQTVPPVASRQPPSTGTPSGSVTMASRNSPVAPTRSGQSTFRASIHQTYRPTAPPLRRTPLLRRVGKLAGAGGASAVAAKGGGAIAGAGALATTAKVALPVAAAIGGAILFDMYLDDKIQGHTDRLQNFMSEEFSAVHQGMAHLGDHFSYNMAVLQENIQNDLLYLGENVEYRFALAMESLERNAHAIEGLAGMLSGFEASMEYAFADLNTMMIDMATRLDYTIALTEALFNDELNAGLKFYDVYLETGDLSQLFRAEQAFTKAQARYEDILLRQIGVEETRGHQMLHGLSSYYRTISYAERSLHSPEYQVAALNSFVEFVNFVRGSDDWERVKLILPVINYTFASIEDIDRNGIAASNLLGTYLNLIDHEISEGRHNSANGLALMLSLALPESSAAQTTLDLVSYVTGNTAWPSEDIWELDTPLLSYTYHRENPQPNTAFALISCAEAQEEGLELPAFCPQTSSQLKQAAVDYQNEMVWKFVVRSLLHNNNVRDAQKVLNRLYISDELFRMKSMLVTNYILDKKLFCDKAGYLLNNKNIFESLQIYLKNTFGINKTCDLHL